MITVEAKKVGTRMIATVKVGIGTGRFTYTVQFADQGSEAANEAEAHRELRKTFRRSSRGSWSIVKGRTRQAVAISQTEEPCRNWPLYFISLHNWSRL